ncbi:MAG: HD domain-containing protein [Desulfofustis sp.]|nr:HD domain-containing protein [Desulfofustis sp.]
MQKSALDAFLSNYPETVLQTLNDCARARGHDIYLVGGALRDLLINVVSVDLDFAVTEKAIDFTHEVHDRLGRGTVVILDEENDTARLVLEELSLDVAGFRKGARTIEEDLVKRDFTINSLAVLLDDLVQPDREVEIVDPLGGFTDLKLRVVRACPGCFDDDPLRLLRAYRFGAQLDFMIEDQTSAQIRARSALIQTAAAERISFELELVMATKQAYRAFKAMQETELLGQLIPELFEGAGVDQPPFHHLDVMEHNLLTLEFVERIIDQPVIYFPRSYNMVDEIAGDGEALSALKWAALFHDIGKPAARKVNVDKKRHITFYNHDEQGADQARQIAERWKWSRRKTKRVVSLIAMHMHPFHLNNLMQDQEGVSTRALQKICKRAGDNLYPLFLLAMADSLAGQGPEKPARIEEQLEQLFVEVERFYRETLVPAAAGPKLLTGHDLITRLNLAQGPEIGRLLEAVETAALEGVITTREEALIWARKQLEEG